MSEQTKSSVVKQPYVRPAIRVYGNIRQLTQASGTRGGFDSPVKTAKTKA